MQILFSAEGWPTGLPSGMTPEQYIAQYGGTLVEMNGDQPSPDHEPCIDGEWRIPQEILIQRETSWSTSEFELVREALNQFLVEEAPSDTSVQTAWKAYGRAILAWKEGAPHFPDSTYRPVRPQ